MPFDSFNLELVSFSNRIRQDHTDLQNCKFEIKVPSGTVVVTHLFVKKY